MASGASFSFERRVFVGEGPLLIGVALNASCIGAGSQSCLLKLESAVWVMAVAALHYSLKHLVMKGLVEIRLHLIMTTHT